MSTDLGLKGAALRASGKFSLGGAMLFGALVLVFVGTGWLPLKVIFLCGILVLSSRHGIWRYVDWNAAFIAFFCVVYALMAQFSIADKTPFSVVAGAFFVAAYLGGKRLGLFFRCDDSRAFALILIGGALGAFSMVGVLNEVLAYGFAGGSRSIAVGSSGGEISATVVAGSLVGLASLGGVLFIRCPLFWRVAMFGIYVLSMFVALRLGSRTTLLLGSGVLLIGLLAGRERGNFGVNRIFGLLGIGLFAGALATFSDQLDLLAYFADRAGSSEHGAATAGGRTERWMLALELLPLYPAGWGMHLNGYSHNFWLDVARNGGWISFSLAILLTTLFAREWIGAVRSTSGGDLFGYLVRALGFSLAGLFFVEPILDGFVYVFAYGCCVWGFLNGRGISWKGGGAR